MVARPIQQRLPETLVGVGFTMRDEGLEGFLIHSIISHFHHAYIGSTPYPFG